MRLCYLADPTSSHTIKWLSYFLRKGEEVHLLGWSHPIDPMLKGVFYHHLPDVLPTIFAVPFRSALWHMRAWPLVLWRQYYKVLSRIKPDIFDVQMLNAPEIPAVMASDGQTVVTPWGSDLLVYPRGYSPVTRFFLGAALRKADLVLCNSQALEVRAYTYGVRRPRIRRVNWTAVDTTVFAPSSTKRELKSQFALSDGPIIFSPRQFLPLYQIETIIESFFGVLDRYPSAQLVLVGDRHVDAIYTSKLDELIRRLRLQDAVVFVPRMENRKMASIYRLADIVVSIPNSDSRPSSVFEAMACGVPVVVSDLAAVREIVADGETGLVTPVGDTTETADAILRLLDDAPLRRRVIAQALEYVRREGDYEVQMGRVATYYADLLSKRTPPECAESADSGSSTARQ